MQCQWRNVKYQYLFEMASETAQTTNMFSLYILKNSSIHRIVITEFWSCKFGAIDFSHFEELYLDMTGEIKSDASTQLVTWRL